MKQSRVLVPANMDVLRIFFFFPNSLSKEKQQKILGFYKVAELIYILNIHV